MAGPGMMDAVEWMRDSIKRGLKEGYYFSLLPRHGVYLCGPLAVLMGDRCIADLDFVGVRLCREALTSCRCS